ncbi:hypothetical protein C9J44_05100 [Photobacterium sp. GB-27]|nr:hypothetical protein C9J40_11335 [Photobacterium sp. GB-72]PSV37744.1 hypothetical protein C9J38_10705 [Photobacterium sp. GB-210]PSV38405.1 hypothetical protein C9J44_05100 [Photobacterium sp. GB-27]PSV44913.1 hypothetical protein C9J46_07500 [Photobacterium sp. GB-36]PSV51463.1 hypothetical protein C9J45_15150 [Photobacterium sp. GB-1]PSV57426.1 hypothetical protein C9J43_07575 [Photobacterium sp. GB-3]PSW74018.1 hypothetical protein C9J41_07545 [Photobacterium sp. GB-50]
MVAGFFISAILNKSIKNKIMQSLQFLGAILLGELYGWFFLNKSFQQPTEAVPSIDMWLPSLYQPTEVVPSMGNSVVFNRIKIISIASDIAAE